MERAETGTHEWPQRRSLRQLENARRQRQQIESHQQRIFDSLEHQRLKLDAASVQTSVRLLELGIA